MIPVKSVSSRTGYQFAEPLVALWRAPAITLRKHPEFIAVTHNSEALNESIAAHCRRIEPLEPLSTDDVIHAPRGCRSMQLRFQSHARDPDSARVGTKA